MSNDHGHGGAQAPYQQSAPPYQQSAPPYQQPPVAAYGYPPRPFYKKVGGMGIASCVAAGLVALLQVTEAVLAWPASEEYLDAARNGVPGYDVMTAYDWIAIPVFAAYLIAYFVTCPWLLRARQNAEQLMPGMPHSRGQVWTWLGWVVPFVWFWFPYQVVRDVARAGRGGIQGIGFVGWWFAAWLGMTFTTQAAGRLSLSTLSEQPPSVGVAEAIPVVESVNAGLALVAFLLWCVVVSEINRDQEARAVLAARNAGIAS